MTDTRTTMKTCVIDTDDSTTIFSVVACQGLVLVAIEVPDTFAGVALTFEGDVDGDDTYQDIYDNAGNQASWVVANSRFIVPTAGSALLAGMTNLRITSGSAEADETMLKLHFVNANA